jgi:hypothetical protein
MKMVKIVATGAAAMLIATGAQATYWLPSKNSYKADLIANLFKPGKVPIVTTPIAVPSKLGDLLDALKNKPQPTEVKQTVGQIVDLIFDEKNGKPVISISHEDVKAIADLLAGLKPGHDPKPEQPGTSEPETPVTPPTGGGGTGSGEGLPGVPGGPVAGAVPEPVTWASMVLGFGLLGAALRGRRRAVGLA